MVGFDELVTQLLLLARQRLASIPLGYHRFERAFVDPIGRLDSKGLYGELARLQVSLQLLPLGEVVAGKVEDRIVLQLTGIVDRWADANLRQDIPPLSPPISRKPAVTTGMEPPGKWAHGIQYVAFVAAQSLLKDGLAISGPQLWDRMLESKLVTMSGKKLTLISKQVLLDNQVSVNESTVKKSWFAELRKLLTGS